jgi:alanine racemase
VITPCFAIVGPNNDAHIYVNELINKGVHNFVVYIPDGCAGANFSSRGYLSSFDSNLRVITVFDFPVIGLTGSNGKRLLRMA